MFRYSRGLMVLALLLPIACSPRGYQCPVQEEIPSFPAYQGKRLKVQVLFWEIRADNLARYPELKEEKVGLGVCNRIAKSLYSSGYFDLLEEKQAMISRLYEQWKKCYLLGDCPEPKISDKADFLIYADVYGFNIRDCSTVSGLKGKTGYETTIELEMRAIPTSGDSEFVATWVKGSWTVQSKEQIWGSGRIDFDDSCVGKATDVAVRKAILTLFEELGKKGHLPVANHN